MIRFIVTILCKWIGAHWKRSYFRVQWYKGCTWNHSRTMCLCIFVFNHKKYELSTCYTVACWYFLPAEGAASQAGILFSFPISKVTLYSEGTGLFWDCWGFWHLLKHISLSLYPVLSYFWSFVTLPLNRLLFVLHLVFCVQCDNSSIDTMILH